MNECICYEHSIAGYLLRQLPYVSLSSQHDTGDAFICTYTSDVEINVLVRALMMRYKFGWVSTDYAKINEFAREVKNVDDAKSVILLYTCSEKAI